MRRLHFGFGEEFVEVLTRMLGLEDGGFGGDFLLHVEDRQDGAEDFRSFALGNDRVSLLLNHVFDFLEVESVGIFSSW